MAWSEEEAVAVFESYWQCERGNCPQCGALVRYAYTPLLGGKCHLAARCPRGCGDFQMGNEQDPRAGTFRDWTEAEAEEVLNNHFTGRACVCPVDGARVDVHEQPYMGGNIVSALCQRCRRGWREDYPQT